LEPICQNDRNVERWPDVRSADLKARIQRNAGEIVRLHERVHETVRHRDQDAEGREAWRRACAEFHEKYDALAFPGGYQNAAQRILAADGDAIEAALCFLELRPYFFRSGYMYQALLRKTKRAALSSAQADRLKAILDRDAAWRAKKARNVV
jgi:hypothetical protein